MKELAANAKRSGDPANWDPPFCGDIDIEIRRDGSWWYLGTPIARIELQRLFARILRRDGEEYFLVTPVEKVRIRVADVPFIVTACVIGDDAIQLHNNVDDCITLDAAHPLIVRGDIAKPQPYVQWRGALLARLSHAVYYEFCELALKQPPQDGCYGVRSAGVFFPLQVKPENRS